MAVSKALQPALEQNRALDALNRKSLAFSVAYGENAQAFVASAYTIEGAIKVVTGRNPADYRLIELGSDAIRTSVYVAYSF